MDWTTMLLIKLGGGLTAMALACVTCVAMEKIIIAGKKILAKNQGIHWPHFHHA